MTTSAHLPVRAPLPVLRTAVFSVASVGFAVAAHTSTEHQLPQLWLIAAAAVAVALATRPLAVLEQRFGGLLAGLVSIQLALHAAFVLAANERPGSGGAAGWLCCGVSQPVTVAHTQSGRLLSPAAAVQLLLHLLAAVLIAVVLSRRERKLWAALRTAVAQRLAALRALVTAAVALLVPTLHHLTLAPGPAETAADRAPRRNLLVVTRRPRRGPPVQALLPA